ncbi:ATP-binding mismatch repair protein [Maudiozyma humilis]|uniref:DNA mismatch repair protein PMS1 n=1 Tax=Maudiozyma humilis TaxID=51915 RepID=A0AAV5RQY1_MAUHU|nr:ATP-binding mismatch repair protein [Kazachstania humilis]
MTDTSLIKAIDVADVNRITSGQVIIDLTSAVKELVDNSIDAGASQIDLLFKNYGIESLECSDNGCGVAKENYQALTLKHHTSKLESFDDIASVTTLGFRGEALFSLCNIAKVTISTTQKGPKADKIEYDRNGKITSCNVVSRNKGTTVEVSDIFNNLPVRRKNFIKTIKKQFAKCITLLQSYAIINENVRFTVHNTTASGKKNLVFRTNNNETMQKKIFNIFGSSCYQGLIPIALSLDMSDVKEEMEKRQKRYSQIFDSNETKGYITDLSDQYIKVNGYISKCSTGAGYNSKDRQYIYMNKRPILYPVLNKCFNETFKNFNNETSVKFPVFFINFEVNPNFIDINVTPDKRTVILNHEDFIVDALRESLVAFFEEQDVSIVKSSTMAKRKRSEEYLDDVFKEESSQSEYALRDSSSPKKVKRESFLMNSFRNDTLPSDPVEEAETQPHNSTDLSSVMDIVLDNHDFDAYPSSQTREDEFVKETSNRERSKSLSEEFGDHEKYGDTEQPDSVNEDPDDKDTAILTGEVNSHRETSVRLEDFKNPLYVSDVSDVEDNTIEHQGSKGIVTMNVGSEEVLSQVEFNEHNGMTFIDRDDKGNDHDLNSHTFSQFDKTTERGGSHEGCCSGNDEQEDSDNESSDSNLVEITQPQETNVRVPAMVFDTDLNKLRMEFQAICDEGDKQKNKNIEILKLDLPVETQDIDLKQIYPQILKLFKDWRHSSASVRASQATVNDDNEDLGEIAQKLTMTVSKKDFSEMSVVGQFNLGFIITTKENPKDNKTDLFIIDQHASDEKYNFETLQKNTVFKSQKLIVPQKLELNIVDELTVIDNLDVFEKNGFKLRVNDDADPGCRIEVISKPTSKNTIFDVVDLNELIHMVREHDGIKKDTIRCSKIRSMFAMRACRMSIMVGKPLNRKTMSKVVGHLSTLDKPWNCPHGRPTMKHLLELNDWNSFTDDYTL